MQSSAVAPPDPAIRFREALNEAQFRAVSAPEGPHLVVAGAGTGKTRTLVYRVAWLVAHGMAPESILLLTFTRRASQEMLRRAAGLLDERCRRVQGGTFHAFAQGVLRRHAERLEISNQFTILDRADAVDLLGLVRTEAGYDRSGKRFPRADTLVELFSKQVNTQKSLRDLIEQSNPQFLDELDAIIDLQGRFGRRKREQSLLDYDDLLVCLRDLLAQHQEVRQLLAGKFRQVLVDEFQDTNRLQAHISALLASVHRNIMVVGDEAQSIYSFRGASFRNIVDFPKIFPGGQMTLLEQSYRSIQPILDLGNAVLARARERYDKQLFSHLPGEQRPILMRCRDDLAQAEFVCKKILELREQNVPLGQIAVLFRAAWHSNALELELANHNLPFRKFGGIRFVDAAHVKDVCALLKLAHNPFDTPAWFRILQLFEGVGPKKAQELTAIVLERDGDSRALIQPKLQVKPFGKDLQTLAELLVLCGRPDLDLAGRLERLLEVYRPWLLRKYDDGATRLRDFEALQVIAARHHDLGELLAELAIDPPEFGITRAGSDGDDEWLTLSTIHSAKGLEWHSVFLLHLNAGRFPSWQALRQADELEEERRLLYVAVTRAKQNLFLLKPEEILTRAQSYEVGELSPLLAEIQELPHLVEQRLYAKSLEPAKAGATDQRDDREQLQRIQDYFG